MGALGLARPAAAALAVLSTAGAACSTSPAATSSGPAVTQGSGGSGGAAAPPPPPPEDMAGKSVERSPDAAHPGYEVVPGWLKLRPGDTVGQAVGVEVDSHNHVF